MDRIHPYDQQLAQCLADIRQIGQPGLSWNFITELIGQCLDRHDSAAIIFLNSEKRKWICLSVLGDQLQESTPIHWKHLVDFSLADRSHGCLAALVRRDGSLLFLYESGEIL